MADKKGNKSNPNMDIRQFTTHGSKINPNGDKTFEPKPSGSKDYGHTTGNGIDSEPKERDPNWRPKKSKSARPYKDSDSDSEDTQRPLKKGVDFINRTDSNPEPEAATNIVSSPDKAESDNNLSVNKLLGNIHGFRKSDNPMPVQSTIPSFSGNGNVLGSTSPSNLSRTTTLLKRLKMMRDKSDRDRRESKIGHIKFTSENSGTQLKRPISSPPYGDNERNKKLKFNNMDLNNEPVAPIPITVGGVTGGDPNLVDQVGACGGSNFQENPVPCPVCQKQISASVINEHLDMCLMG